MSMRVGVFIDASNLGMNGGNGLRYDILGLLASKGSDVAQRLNVYLAYDPERAEKEYLYRNNTKLFHNRLRGYGFKVCIKEVKTYQNFDGTKTSKSNADMELAVDLLLQSDKLDRVILGTGDGDFTRLISALQDKGLRVDVLAFRNCSRTLIETADSFMSGYLIPNLVPNPYFSQNPTYSSTTTSNLKSNEIQATGVVLVTNIETKKSIIKYLKEIPGSFLDTDSAWAEVEVTISDDDLKKHTMMRGNVIAWLADKETMQPVTCSRFVKLSN